MLPKDRPKMLHQRELGSSNLNPQGEHLAILLWDRVTTHNGYDTDSTTIVRYYFFEVGEKKEWEHELRELQLREPRKQFLGIHVDAVAQLNVTVNIAISTTKGPTK